MQKSSAFEKGLKLLGFLDSRDAPGSPTRRIFRLKYLAQEYRYSEALLLSEEIGDGDDEWGAVYRINTLMSLGRNDEARAITDTRLSETMSECQAVLRRNTITLFDTETALRHLDEAYRYFEQYGSIFRLATVDTNRSVVYLHSDRPANALLCLERAQHRMRCIGSPEIYQAQINLAVQSAMLGDYDSALNSLDKSDSNVPRTLLLDQVKISMNRIVVESIIGVLDPKGSEQALAQCLRRIHDVPMPELRRTLISNMAAARGESSLVRGFHGEQASTSMDLAVGVSVSTNVTWTLLMSIHWRY